MMRQPRVAVGCLMKTGDGCGGGEWDSRGMKRDSLVRVYRTVPTDCEE